MRYKRGVEKLRILAGTCERVKAFWFDTEPFLKAVYAFGEVVDGADPLDAVHVTVPISLSPEEVPWESSPEGTDWLANELRLSKGGFMYFWRSYLDPIWNHYIRGPVRVWSVDDGPDERALTALGTRGSGFGPMTNPVVVQVHPLSEVRKRLSGILARFRREGAAAEPVAFGSHRKPEAILLPYEVYERYEALSRQHARLDSALAAAQSVQVELPGPFSPDHDREVAAYVDGEISAAELYRRTVARYRQP